MWLINSWRYLIMLLLSVHLSFQDDEQPSNDKSMMKKYNRMLQETLSDFLETQLQVLLDDTITDLIQNKLPNIIDDRLSKIIGEKLNEHVTVMERFDVLEYMQSDLSNTTYNNGVKLQNHQELMNESFIIVQRKLDSIEEKCIGKLQNTTVCIEKATCDVTTCEGNTECWDNDGQQQAECRCKTGYISLQNQCKATCDVTTCDGNKECWDNNQQQEAECRCKTGYISLQNQCKATCDVTTCEGNKECWDNNGEQEAECKVLGCSEAQLAQGFFHLPGSKQCLKAFTDEDRTWPDAKAKCESEGLALATIQDDDAVAIRKKMVDNVVGDDYGTWVGGRGDDSWAMRWDRSGEVLAQDNALWYPGRGSNVSSGRCLALRTSKWSMQQQPDRPYYAESCSGRKYTLCSVILE